MIELQKVTKRHGDLLAVDGVSLRVEPGELLVLLGGSGSGKTTTLKMINRLIEPTSGRILLDGRDVAETPPHALRRSIGYVFQQIGLFPHLTIAENIAITPSLLGWAPARIRARVDALLDLVELDPAAIRDRRPDELSGGQAQRVGVARALAAEPKVMLLDEPFGALDPLTRDRLQRSFLRIRRQLGLTAIFVTHDMIEAILLGDRIAVMGRGRLLQVGTARELARAPVDDEVAQLLSTPQRQARRVEALLGGEGGEGGDDGDDGDHSDDGAAGDTDVSPGEAPGETSKETP
ncbi:ABC transporter ATP-binding protein [Chondromyces apiculatus]|uniref:ABC transporter related protein n=1 Tax=Chondromyces apiculatus DSM 436 TaxID=1192034 RepID=A0A017T3W9_9BACT|nr:ABC transporter ATP-binding protein [Chondromyces apiculatus]EYF03938.1 ABC transporter related protein [Chondromyces apiculatus DSM 436]